MAADPIVYCLDEVTDYVQFERLCHDLMTEIGYSAIEPLGRFRDRGRDALDRCESDGRVTIFAYSVREDWKSKLREDAAKIHDHGHECSEFVFVTTADVNTASRDELTDEIRESYGWRLSIYGSERLRVCISSKLEHFVNSHPQILTPRLFDNRRPAFDLEVCVVPTWNRRNLLAQIRLFNRGTSPLFVESWYAEWGVGSQARAVRSWNCIQGALPCRLPPQAPGELLVDISEEPVDDLIRLGVLDGESRRWLASDDNIQNFISTAKQYEPPAVEQVTSPPAPPTEDIDIDVYPCENPTSPSFPLEVVVRNRGAQPLEILGAAIAWSYEPPVASNAQRSGRPIVEEIGGRVSLAPSSNERTVGPGLELRWYIPRELIGTLVRTLKNDVPDGSIAVLFGTTTGYELRGTGDDVARAIRDAARNVIRSWDAE